MLLYLLYIFVCFPLFGVFIAMSMLIKDMNSQNDSFRANSIRVLSRILDPAMAAQIDRYLKTAIVDKNPFVCSSALVCGITLMKAAPDVVRRWISEVQENVNSKHHPPRSGPPLTLRGGPVYQQKW